MSTKKQKREKLQKAREETAKENLKCTTTQTLIGIFALASCFCLGFPSPSSHRSGRIQLCAYRQGNGIVRGTGYRRKSTAILV